MTEQRQQPEAGPEPPQPGLRFLEATVYIMGGLLVLMLVVLIGGVAWKASRRAETPPEAPKQVDLGFPLEGLQEMLLDGDRLAVRTAGEIVVIDIRKGAILARIRSGAAP